MQILGIRELKFYKKRIYITLFAMGIITVLMWFFVRSLIITIPGAILFYFLLKKINPFARGLEGEASVSDQIRKLPPEFSFFSDIQTDKSQANIDKVVIGPTGVWVLEVKSHRGNIKEVDPKFIKQVWAESYAVRDLIKEKLNLDVSVQPVLVFSSPQAKMHFGFNKVDGVYVINQKWLNDLLVMHPVSALDSDTTTKIKSVFI
jgi:hypothetical protein